MDPVQPISRRQLLQQSAVGFGYLAAAALLAEESRAGAALADATAAMPHFQARAKRVIFLFMLGGPSHVDTFDHKPLLERDHGKPYPLPRPRFTNVEPGTLLASPWKFHRSGQCGMPVSELFPHLARCVDDICFLHAVHGTNVAHGAAIQKVHTGSENAVRPSVGSWINYGLGSENSNLPGFVTICPTLHFGGSHNWGSAFLPVAQGTPLGNSNVPADQAQVRHIRNARLPEHVQRLQLNRLLQMNRDHQRQSGPELSLEARIESFELAFRMQRAMPEAESLAGETPATRRLYGLDHPATRNFGLQCLLARRLSERGVRFVQVTHSEPSITDWDQHEDLLHGHAKNARAVDVPIAGLLRDLKARGLLDDTLVWWGGEFGRTPTGQQSSPTGRDHNPEGFTMWLAGGGVKGGLRHGATDDYGWYGIDGKVHIHDLHATILHLLGLDHERLTYHYAGRDHRLTDVHGNVVRDIFR